MAGHVHGATSGRFLWLSLIITALFVVVELFFGFRALSLALISDAGHNASDALALGLAAYAIWVAKRPATHGKTFGYHRVAILTAFFNSLALILISVGILIGSWEVFLHPQPIRSGIMISVATAALLMNTVIAYWLHAGSKNSLNVRAAYLHMMGDAISSFGVVIAGIVVHFTHWTLADPLVSVMIAAFILYSSWGIIVDATNILLEGSPKDLDIHRMVGGMRAVDGVQDVHDLHVWTVGEGIHFLSCHVVLAETATMTDVAAVVKCLNTMLHDDFAIGHATIQTEIGDCDGCHIDPNDLYCALESHAIGCGHDH
jgi:cobalt-zinc-cadmium efflux system protein